MHLKELIAPLKIFELRRRELYSLPGTAYSHVCRVKVGFARYPIGCWSGLEGSLQLMKRKESSAGFCVKELSRGVDSSAQLACLDTKSV